MTGFGQQPAKGREDPHAKRGSYGAVNRDVHARLVRHHRANIEGLPAGVGNREHRQRRTTRPLSLAPASFLHPPLHRRRELDHKAQSGLKS